MTKRAKEMFEEIAGTVEHGECFYNERMLNELFLELEEFKMLAIQEFESNKED